MSGHIVSMSVIARRSRHFAGTRFLKRGVNEQGRFVFIPLPLLLSLYLMASEHTIIGRW